MSNPRKKHYYVLVLTDEGPVFMTQINRDNKTVEYKQNQPPLEVTKIVAEDIAMGLRANLICAFAVTSTVSMLKQLFKYEKGHFEWINDADKTNDGWILASEQLPTDDEVKLVTCQTKKGVRTWNRAYYSNGSWSGSGSMSNVIAWKDMKMYEGDLKNDG